VVLLRGRATPDGTARFAARAQRKQVHPSHFSDERSGLHLSSIGLGTYLGEEDGPTDLAVTEAARLAVGSGRVNLLDTAINYRNQRAERSLGRALGLLSEAGVAREEVFVASKAGYLAPDGESGLAPASWVQSELIQPKVLAARDIVDGSHAMTPAYLRDQARRSRENLGIETLDLLYLHNSAEAQQPWVGREAYLERLGSAFEEFERLRSDGWIAHYGLATWDSLRSPRSAPAHLELESALALAVKAGGTTHGFHFLQFPFNVAMPEASALRSQRVGGRATSLFVASQALHLGCFTSVPLLQGQLLDRLPAADGLSPAQWAVQFARSAPGNLAPLVGMKRPEHLAEDLTVAEQSRWGAEAFRSRLEQSSGVADAGGPG
jgi:aryl-alcohol dehydrogenase-like predicted oxidoreductase